MYSFEIISQLFHSQFEGTCESSSPGRGGTNPRLGLFIESPESRLSLTHWNLLKSITTTTNEKHKKGEKKNIDR